MRSLSLAFLAVLAAHPLVGCTDIEPTTDTDTAALSGTLVVNGGPPSTVAVRWSTWGSHYGSNGAVIRSDAVLTLGWEYAAGHETAATTFIQPNPTSVWGNPAYPVDHINIVASPFPNGAPLAILYLRCSLDPELVPPAPISSHGKDFVKATSARVASYGNATVASNASTVWAGVRRSATVAPTDVTVASGSESWYIQLTGQLGVGFGDSGAPLYLEVENQWRVAGITQFGSQSNSIGGPRVDQRAAAIAQALAGTPQAPPCPATPGGT